MANEPDTARRLEDATDCTSCYICGGRLGLGDMLLSRHGSAHRACMRPPYAKPLATPYPFCRTPTICAGKGYCPHDIACNN